MNLTDFNRIPLVEGFSDGVAQNLGGAGGGFEFFDRHMGAVGITMTNAPQAEMAMDVSGPQNDLTNLILGRKPSGLNNG